MDLNKTFLVLGLVIVFLLGLSFFSTSQIIGFAVKENNDCVWAEDYFNEQKEFYDCSKVGDREVCVLGDKELRLTVKDEYKEWYFNVDGVEEVYKYDLVEMRCKKLR